MLRPVAGPPGALRAAGLEPGGKAPGRARTPSVRDPPAPRVDPRGRCRGTARLHGRRRAPRRRVLRDRETADQEDSGRTRCDSAGAGHAPVPPEGTRIPPRRPGRVRERGQVVAAERLDR